MKIIDYRNFTSKVVNNWVLYMVCGIYLILGIIFFISPVFPADLSVLTTCCGWESTNSYNDNMLLSDPPLQIIPFKFKIIDNYSRFETSFWNDTLFLGQPFAANVQSGAFSILNVVYLMFGKVLGYKVIYIFQYLFGFISFYILLTSKYKISNNVSSVASLAFILSANFLVWSEWNTISIIISSSPLIAYYIFKYFQSGQYRSLFTIIFLIFFVFSIGHLQFALISLIFGVIVNLNEFIKNWKRAVLIIFSFLAGLGMSFPQLWLFSELNAISYRYSSDIKFFDFSVFNREYFSLSNLIFSLRDLLWSSYLQSKNNYNRNIAYNEYAIFINIFFIPIILISIFKIKKNIFELFVFILFLLVSCGSFIFNCIVFIFPFFSQVSSLRFISVVNLFGIIIFAKAMSILDLHLTNKYKTIFHSIIFLGVLTGGAIFINNFLPFDNENILNNDNVYKFLIEYENISDFELSQFRIITPNDQNSNMYYNFSRVGGYDSLYPQKTFELIQSINYPFATVKKNPIEIINFNKVNTLRNLGVKYIISKSEISIDGVTEVIPDYNSFKIYKINNLGLTLAYFPKKISYFNSNEDELEYMKNTDMQDKEILLNEQDKYNLSENNSIRVLKYLSDEKIFEVETDVETILFLNISYDKFWRVEINDKNVSTLLVNHSMMGVLVPSGKSVVKMIYNPFTYLVR